MDQIIGLTVGSNGRWCPKIRNMTLGWTLNVPDAGADRMLSIEDMVWNSQRTSVSATVGGMPAQSQGASRQVRTRGCGLWNDLKPSPLQRYFWVRNAPYALRDPCNSLKSQQMRPPSERTTSKSHKLKPNARIHPRCRTPDRSSAGHDRETAGTWPGPDAA